MINFFTATLPVATFLLQGDNAEQSILRVQLVREQDQLLCASTWRL
jgi:hypothetical protein